jgi:hypothetical protein
MRDLKQEILNTLGESSSVTSELITIIHNRLDLLHYTVRGNLVELSTKEGTLGLSIGDFDSLVVWHKGMQLITLKDTALVQKVQAIIDLEKVTKTLQDLRSVKELLNN